MELKVWVEGIQRVVCGVNDATTCQDVVYALAHATGQTGRFTLVEKWRHSERLLPPQEHPLKVLTKWGEYAGDVQFILRRSADKKAHHNNNKNISNVTQLGLKKKSTELQPFSPTSPPATTVLPSSPTHGKELKKSLTFSGSHGSNGSTSSGSGSSSGQSTPQNSHNNSGSSVQAKADNGWDPQVKGRDPNRIGRQDLPRGIVKGVPQERGSPARPRQPPSYDEAVSRYSRHHMSSQLTPYNPERDSPSSKRRYLAAGPRISPLTSKEQRLSPNRTADTFSHNVMSQSPSGNDGYRRDNILTSPLMGSPKDSHWSSEKTRARKNLICEFKSEESTKSEKEPKTDSVVVLVNETEEPQYRDLIRLVSLQREKLTNQNAELSQYDTEIVYWESKLQEQESKLASLEEETRRLERLSGEQDQELTSLEKASQMEGQEGGHQDERVLRSKLSLSRAQLTTCETQLAHARQRLRHLADEIAESHRKKAEQEKEVQEWENQSKDLKLQMGMKNEEQSKQKDLLNEVEQELKALEQNLADRQSQLEKLTVELREANLQALSMTIADDIKCLSEGNFHNRSGSTRRIMGSPRQLENAVPTSKNPHGVWV